MKKEVVIISLGGSLIIPGKVNYDYLKRFKKVLFKLSKRYKFVVVCGGGYLAREYIKAIVLEKGNLDFQAFAGINATRANARFVSYFFGKDPFYGIPKSMRTLKKYLKKRDIVFCGALEYKPNQTSDSTSAFIAKEFNSIFINLSNVFGLYDKNPLKYKNAKFISKISWKGFDKMAQKIKFKPGQNFILDQTASKIIMKNKISTYLLKNPEEISKVLSGKKYKGSLIEG
jgi:uridylate kinase